MQIIRRSRLGNDTEDITLFAGPLTRINTIAVMDGYDVLNVQPTPLTSTASSATTQPAITQTAVATQLASPITRPTPRLFSILGLGVKAGPRGIAYVPSRQEFAFNDPIQVTSLFFTDARGLPRDPVAIQYQNGQPVLVEGLGYIPAGSASFPDSLLMVATFEDDTSASGVQTRVEVIDFKGAVLTEVVPQDGLSDLFLTGVCFRSPGTLLVSSDDDETIYEIDFKGKKIASYNASPFPDPGRPVLHGIEGLTQLSTGQVAAAGGFDGILALLNLTGDVPAPQFLDYRIGFGLSLPSGLAWDSTANQFLIVTIDRQRPDAPFIASVSSSLDSFRLVLPVDPTTRKVTYIPAEQTIAATHPNNPRGILLFRGSRPAGQIDTSALGSPVGISFIPNTNEFVLVFSNSRNKLSILTRQGALSRTISFAPAGITRVTAVTPFNPAHPSGGQFLVFDNTQDLAVVTDFNGNKLSQFSIKEAFKVLNPSAVAAITTGPDAGAFALTNTETSEIVVFRLE